MAIELNLSRVQAIYFRDQLREARANALRDAEGFQQVLFAVERLGSMLCNDAKGLGDYKDALKRLMERSLLADSVADEARTTHVPFDTLFDLVKDARNDALHQGARVRHLTRHAVSLALRLEDALITFTKETVADFMVRDPVCAAPWHLMSFIRQTMLENSFSYLPVNLTETGPPAWYLVSDQDVATYLGGAPSKTKRRELLGLSLSQALEGNLLRLDKAESVEPDEPPWEVLKKSNGRPVLVIEAKHRGRLHGIVAPFDLL